MHEEDIYVIRNLMLNLDVEMCGSMRDGRIFVEKTGTRLKNRGMCQLNKYSKIIWHTHPKIFRAYPSVEDVLNMLKWHPINKKNNFPEISLIFTDWGVWTIKCITKFHLDEQWYTYLYSFINNALAPLWEQGIEYNESTLGLISKAISEIEELNNNEYLKCKLYIEFQTWE